MTMTPTEEKIFYNQLELMQKMADLTSTLELEELLCLQKMVKISINQYDKKDINSMKKDIKAVLDLKLFKGV
jgi:hypothetical protein|tara:strand:+ start:270 stop:485 length:216 start_codon:yes stop_codon:yes gene_type:complete